MNLGRVVGRTWATVKNASLEGQRLLIVQPVTPEGESTGRRLVCTDWAGAGAGELVYWARAREATFPFLPDEVVTDATIVGIVDEVHVKRH
jgi:ethanolamine utilization protein EutN